RVDNEGVAFPVSARISDPLPQVRSQMRTSIERNDSSTVNRLRHDDDVAWALDDLQVGVVDGRQQRWNVGAPREAALEQRAVLRSVGRIASSPGALGRAPLPLGRQGRNSSITRVGDKRSE